MQLEQIQALPFHVRATIPSDYLDIFGHMNIQFYLKIFNSGIFKMFAQMGMDESFFMNSGRGMYALEQHIKYMAEVHEGNEVAVYSRLFGRNEKRIHFMLFMINESNLRAHHPKPLSFGLDDRGDWQNYKGLGNRQKKGDRFAALMIFLISRIRLHESRG